jgi:hypothetical protein
VASVVKVRIAVTILALATMAVAVVALTRRQDDVPTIDGTLKAATKIASFVNAGGFSEVAGIKADGGCYVNEEDGGTTIDNGPYCGAVARLMGSGWRPPHVQDRCLEGWQETHRLLDKCVAALETLVPLDGGTKL